MHCFRCRAAAVTLVLGFTSLAAIASPPPVLETRPTSGNEPPAPQHTSAVQTGNPEASIIPAGVPLRIQLDGGYPVKVGTRVEGHLIQPVYRIDHIVLPANTRVTGIIGATHPVPRGARAGALLNGDFTPLAVADITFNSVQLPDGTAVPISTQAEERTASVIHMTAGKKQSLTAQVKARIRQQRQDALSTVTAPGKGDRIRRYVYQQLPYHPQRIWTGTQYDADLTAPLTVPDKTVPMPVLALGKIPPAGIIQARLTTSLTSATTQKGAVVEAILSKPLIDASGHQVMLPEGTRLEGSVLQVKPAAWFGRSGSLRFTFRNLAPADGMAGKAPEQQEIHGQMTAAEATADQNLSIDSEGGAKAGADKGKVLAPLVLGLLAVSSMDRDRDHDGLAVKNGVVSNGFGLAVRVFTMASGNRDVASGFAYFALSKSIYKRWIAKGHETVFPRDTMLEVQLASR